MGVGWEGDLKFFQHQGEQLLKGLGRIFKVNIKELLCFEGNCTKLNQTVNTPRTSELSLFCLHKKMPGLAWVRGAGRRPTLC